MRWSPNIKALLVVVSLCAATQAHGTTLFDNAVGSADFALFPFWQQVLTDAPAVPESGPGLAPVARPADASSVMSPTTVSIGLPQGCAEARHCVPPEWQIFLTAQYGLTRRAQLEAVNQWANAKPYVEDWVNWQVADYWETPGEFIAKGGDCEDFAIAKYFSLVRLGFPIRDLRIVVLSDTRTHGFHAALAVRLDGRVWLLDNFLPDVVPLESQPQYVPVYSLNSDGWWMHSNPTIQLAGITITAAPIANSWTRLARN